MPFGGRNSIFRKPFGTGSGSVSRRVSQSPVSVLLRSAEQKIRKEINNASKAGNQLLTDFKNNDVLNNLGATDLEIRIDFDSQVSAALEGINLEHEKILSGLAKAAVDVKVAISSKANELKYHIRKYAERSRYDSNYIYINPENLNRIIKGIENEIVKAKAEVDEKLKEAKDNIERELEKAKDDITKELESAKREIDDAIDASKTYFEEKLESVGDTLTESEQLIAQGKYLDAIWHISTEPIQDESANLSEAVSRSTLLNSIVATAASVYGGPAGAAAYSAWLTYERTGDLDSAVRIGIGAGICAYAAGGSTNIAGEGLSAEAKRILLKSTVNAAAVAANGGSQKDIESTFMQTVERETLAVSQAALRDYTTEQLNAHYPELLEIERELSTIGEDIEEISDRVADFESDWNSIVDEAYRYRQITLDGQGAPKGSYFLNFYGYNKDLGVGRIGHVWVGFIQKDDEKVLSDIRLGFWPVEASIRTDEDYFNGKAQGELRSDKDTNHEHMFTREVSATQFAKANEVVSKWKNMSSIYQVLKRDCVSFLIDVANAAELSPPQRQYWQPDIEELERLQQTREHLHYLRMFLDPEYKEST